ncbi:MAG: hypothetical protein AAGJ38_02915 [Planctomycetota bacterium]
MLSLQQNLVTVLAAALLTTVIGCSSSGPSVADRPVVTATFADGLKACLDSPANTVAVRSEDQRAVFFIDQATLTVTPENVLSSNGQRVPLPGAWSRIDLAHVEDKITIRIDGKRLAWVGL